MYIAMTLLKKLENTFKDKFDAANKEQGVLGVLPVFKYKKDARKIFGKKIELVEVAEVKNVK